MRVVIVGAGEVGLHIAARLVKENNDVLLVDRDPERVKLAKETLDVQTLRGHGCSPKLLAQAGIDTTDVLIAVTTSDEVNIIACMIAASQSSSTMKIARIRNQEYVQHPGFLESKHLGVDLHINPEREAADAIYKTLQIPCAKEAIDLGDGKVKLVGVPIGQDSSVIGQQLRYLAEFHPDKKVLIAAIERRGKIIIPGGDDALETGDMVWVISTPTKIDNVLAGLGLRYEPIRRVMLFGGTMVGEFLAGDLLAAGINLRIVEGDYRRCVELAEKFPRAVVLHSESLDRDLFEEENIANVDAFISTSDDDEDNILSALLAKRQGVGKVVTVLQRATYNQIVSSIGVDNIISKRLAAVNRIMAYMRKGKVRNEISLGDGTIEVLEFEALETSDVAGKPLMHLAFPRGARVVAIIRGDEVTIPGGRDAIEVGDRVLILTNARNIKALEKMFSVKLTFF